MAISIALLAGYALHATQAAHPLLRLGLLRIRTFQISVVGSLLTRLGIGGLPFLLPLLYQVGLGYSPLESGLLIMPQSLAAMGLKMVVQSILHKFGYRRILVSNTLLLGILIMFFATIHTGTAAWMIVVQSCLFGFFSSLQYTCMNTLVYADIEDDDTSMASTIVSTAQQMSLSFGVAAASLVTGFFIKDRLHATREEFISGLHQAFIVLGIVTMLSTIIFRRLKNNDGDAMSLHGEHTHELK
jgi:MFS family permease